VNTTAVQVSDLSKSYGDVVAVDRISFSIARGSVCGLLGANGAGKTTTIAMLLGLVTPTAGSIRIFGEDALADRYRVLPRMNFSSPYVELPQSLSVRENLTVYARLYDVPDIPGRLRVLAQELGLEQAMDRKYRTLSAGMRTRVTLAKSLLNEPELILLDEPTASLDPDTADRVRKLLLGYQRRTGATILLTSHNMTEVERICDQVMIMRAGRLVDQGTPQQLLARYGHDDMEKVFLQLVREAGAPARQATGG
jgi:ABC-2 type transport system ATP-binding protein